MSESINPQSSNYPPIDEAMIQHEERVAALRAEFRVELDSEQLAAFEDIFSPQGQIELIRQTEAGGSSPMWTHLGYYPTEMSPIQQSVYALMSASLEERHVRYLPEDSSERQDRAHEAEQLRVLAKKFRDEAR